MTVTWTVNQITNQSKVDYRGFRLENLEYSLQNISFRWNTDSARSIAIIRIRTRWMNAFEWMTLAVCGQWNVVFAWIDFSAFVECRTRSKKSIKHTFARIRHLWLWTHWTEHVSLFCMIQLGVRWAAIYIMWWQWSFAGILLIFIIRIGWLVSIIRFALSSVGFCGGQPTIVGALTWFSFSSRCSCGTCTLRSFKTWRSVDQTRNATSREWNFCRLKWDKQIQIQLFECSNRLLGKQLWHCTNLTFTLKPLDLWPPVNKSGVLVRYRYKFCDAVRHGTSKSIENISSSMAFCSAVAISCFFTTGLSINASGKTSAFSSSDSSAISVSFISACNCTSAVTSIDGGGTWFLNW